MKVTTKVLTISSILLLVIETCSGAIFHPRRSVFDISKLKNKPSDLQKVLDDCGVDELTEIMKEAIFFSNQVPDYMSLIEALKSKPNSDINVLLIDAVRRNNMTAVEALLNAGADARRIKFSDLAFSLCSEEFYM